MTTTHRKLLVGSLVFGLATALMGWSIWREGWVYYMSVDEFVELNFAERDVQRVRLMGIAGASDFEVSHGGLWARFDLNGRVEGNTLRVEYKGVIPDMFNPGHEVIVEGRMNGDGIFEADTLMTKCGSRYESDEDKQRMPHADPRNPRNTQNAPRRATEGDGGGLEGESQLSESTLDTSRARARSNSSSKSSSPWPSVAFRGESGGRS